MPSDELICLRFQLRAVLARRQCQVAAGAKGYIPVHHHFREDLGPELHQIVIHDRGFDQPGIDHLQQVIVLETFRCINNEYRLPSLLLEARVESAQAVVLAACLANKNFLPA